MTTVAFDVDNTIYKVTAKLENGVLIPTGQVPDYETIALLLWHVKNGDEVIVWSAGGIQYAKSIVEKLGLSNEVLVFHKHQILRKDGSKYVDICYDDMEVNLAKVNVKVNNREYTQGE